MSQIAEGFKDKGLVGSEVTWSTSYEPSKKQKEAAAKLREEFQPAAARLAAEMFNKIGK